MARISRAPVRAFVRHVGAVALGAGVVLQATAPEPLPFAFVNVAREAGLNGVTVYGDRDRNRYLLETTG